LGGIMKIVVPYVTLHPVTRHCLESEKLDAEYVQMQDDDDYRRLMQRLWRENKPVVIVEHDIAPWPGAIRELWECPCAWGAYSYKIDGGIGIYHGLGCTKLTPRLMAAVPKIWDRPEPWHLLDQIMFFAARNEGWEPHHHRPAVIHLKAS
jgi:hypothetical protein